MLLGTWKSFRPKIPGIVLSLLAVGIVAYSAIRSTQPSPPTLAEAVVLQVSAAVAGLSGGIVFGRIGRADPRHARSAVRRLVTIGRNVGLIEMRIQASLASSDKNQISSNNRAAAEVVSAVKLQIYDSILDWKDVHESAVDDLVPAGGQQ
jgi:hypothetical protein